MHIYIFQTQKKIHHRKTIKTNISRYLSNIHGFALILKSNYMYFKCFQLVNKINNVVPYDRHLSMIIK